jgi:hypothetical protein
MPEYFQESHKSLGPFVHLLCAYIAHADDNAQVRQGFIKGKTSPSATTWRPTHC